MKFPADFAWHDLRASGASLWVFCACLFLGAALVAATGGLHRLINEGLLADTRQLLGGDLEVDADKALPADAVAWMNERGDVSLVVELDTMLGTTADEFLRVELQSMDARYPLYGELVLAPDRPLAEITEFADGQWGVAIDSSLAERLGLSVGDDVYVGSLTVRIRALVVQQPDRALSADWRGAPVLIGEAALTESGLLRPGSRLDFDYRVRTAMPPDAWQQAFYEAFPDQPWEVRTFEDRSRRIAERLGQLSSGLLIIGLSTLFIGGLGVFNSIHAYLQTKTRTIATLRALGLRNRRLASIYLLQIVIMAGGASVAGALAGGALAMAAAVVVAAEIPISIAFGRVLVPQILAISFGMLTALTFALPALGRALCSEPARLFRGNAGEPSRSPLGWWLASLACALLIALGILLSFPDTAFAIGFLLTILAVLLVFEIVVRGVRGAAIRLDRHPALAGRFNLRLALANLHRPGAPLRTTLLSLGTALTLLVACVMVVASLVRTINETIPAESPALVLYDIGDHQLADVVAALHRFPGTRRVDTTPLVRSRITALNDIPLTELEQLDDGERRDASRDEYDLSYAANNIDDVSIVAGDWWQSPVTGVARMAVEDREAEQLGLQVGDSVTFDIAGRELHVQIDAIFSQKGLQTRFWFEGIVSDGALAGFIDRHVGAAYMDDNATVAAQRQIGAMAPNVITVRTAALLDSARDILGKASIGLAVVAGISLLASLLVLISVMAAGRNRQVYEATVLHSVGARMAVIRRGLQLEYLVLAVITSAFALLMGAAIAMPLLSLRLKLGTDNLLWLGLLTAATVSTLSLSLGGRYLMRRLRIRPATLLRGSG